MGSYAFASHSHCFGLVSQSLRGVHKTLTGRALVLSSGPVEGMILARSKQITSDTNIHHLLILLWQSWAKIGQRGHKLTVF